MDPSELTVEVEITRACNVLETPRKIGDKVLVDPNTARSLMKKGWVKSVEAVSCPQTEPIVTINQ